MRLEVSLPEQLAINQKYAPAALTMLSRFISENPIEIVDASLHRLETIGFDQYGDEMFHQSDSRLVREIVEELADAVNRCAVRLARMNGELSTGARRG